MPLAKHIVAQWRMCGECYRFAWAAVILETLSRFTLALLRCPAFLCTICNINLLEMVQYSLSKYWCVLSSKSGTRWRFTFNFRFIKLMLMPSWLHHQLTSLLKVSCCAFNSSCLSCFRTVSPHLVESFFRFALTNFNNIVCYYRIIKKGGEGEKSATFVPTSINKI